MHVKMIDNEDTTLLDDPFDNSEKDPAKSNAIGSSLWEIKSLEEHLLPQVSSVAKDLIEKGLRERAVCGSKENLDFCKAKGNTYRTPSARKKCRGTTDCSRAQSAINIYEFASPKIRKIRPGVLKMLTKR